MQAIQIGDTLTCAETGKQFTAEKYGCTYNYAFDAQGNTYSDEGVDIREKRALSDRSKPFSAYLSCDGKRITGWKGNTLMTCDTAYQTGSGFGRKQWYVSAVDVHGKYWFGRGAGKGMYITLRAKKAPR